MAKRGKAIQFSRTGNPAEVVELIDIDEPDPVSGNILCKIEAAPIAPSHFETIWSLRRTSRPSCCTR